MTPPLNDLFSTITTQVYLPFPRKRHNSTAAAANLPPTSPTPNNQGARAPHSHMVSLERESTSNRRPRRESPMVTGRHTAATAAVPSAAAAYVVLGAQLTWIKWKQIGQSGAFVRHYYLCCCSRCCVLSVGAERVWKGGLNQCCDCDWLFASESKLR